MGASAYTRDRARIYAEADQWTRGKGFRKAALARLDKEHHARPIRRCGKIVGTRFYDTGLVVCKKKAFANEELARASIAEIERFQGAGHAKPVRAYECPYCHQFHTSKIATYVAFDDSVEK